MCRPAAKLKHGSQQGVIVEHGAELSLIGKGEATDIQKNTHARLRRGARHPHKPRVILDCQRVPIERTK
ncbi:hypothetical protein PP613_03830 [Mycobacteroides abscessus]|nr:hypothetical protein [Mycobacteroides abscessus]MDM2408479.1 hypothetical protein [Mycobacteroides abscessus]